MTRRVLVSHRLPELQSGNPALDLWVREHLQKHVAEVFEQISFLTPESGTWTPVVRGSGTAGTYELASAGGLYYRIADYVIVNVYLTFAAAVTGGGTGDLNITGQPFAAVAGGYPMGAIVMNGVDVAAATVSVGLALTSGNTALLIQQTIDDAANVVLPISAVAANDVIGGTIIFEAGDRQ